MSTDLDQINAVVAHSIAWMRLAPETERHAERIASLGRIDTLDSARAAGAIAMEARACASAAYVADPSPRDPGLFTRALHVVLRAQLRVWSDRLDQIATAQYVVSGEDASTVAILDALTPLWHRVDGRSVTLPACLAARRARTLDALLAVEAALA